MQCTFSGSTDSSIRRSVAVKESLKGELNYASNRNRGGGIIIPIQL